MTAPVDVYTTWIDELEKANASPFAEGEDREFEERYGDHESDHESGPESDLER